MITNFDYLAEKLPMLDLTNLKVSIVCPHKQYSVSFYEVLFLSTATI